MHNHSSLFDVFFNEGERRFKETLYILIRIVSYQYSQMRDLRLKIELLLSEYRYDCFYIILDKIAVFNILNVWYDKSS